MDAYVNTEAYVDQYFRELPPGYGFRPTDEELVVYYLMNKALKRPMPLHRIKTCNIYRSHPSELSRLYDMIREKESYFFTTREKKYPNGSRPDRKAGDGFWKATGRDFPIRSKGKVIGFKKTLVYYEGKPKGTIVKTNWIMHEYTLNQENIPSTSTPITEGPDDNNILDKCVLVKIYEKTIGSNKVNGSPPQDSQNVILDSKQLPAEAQDMMILESEKLPTEAQYNMILESEQFLTEAQDEVILESEQLASEAKHEMISELEQFQVEAQDIVECIKEPEALQVPNPQEPVCFGVPQVDPYPYHQNPMPAAAYHGNDSMMNKDFGNFQNGGLTYQNCYHNKPFYFQVEDGFWNSQYGGLEDYCCVEEMGFGNADPSVELHDASSGMIHTVTTEEHIDQRKRKRVRPADMASRVQKLTASPATLSANEDQKIATVALPKQVTKHRNEGHSS